MIIRCPDCSTDFQLPDERVGGDPIKVRCSRCSHVFRVASEGGEPVRYTESGERISDDSEETTSQRESPGEAGADEPDDAGETQFGGPTASTSDETDEAADETDEAADETNEAARATQFGSPGTAEASEPDSSGLDDDSNPAGETRFGAPSSRSDDAPDAGASSDDNDPSQTMLGTPGAEISGEHSAVDDGEASPRDSRHTLSDTPPPSSDDELQTPSPGSPNEADSTSRPLEPDASHRTRHGTPGPGESSETGGEDDGRQRHPSPGAQIIDHGSPNKGNADSEIGDEETTTSTSASAESGFNPFPHADETVEPKKDRAIVDDGASSPSEASESEDDEDIELFDGDEDAASNDDDPFEGAFEGDDRQRTSSGTTSTASSDDSGDPLAPNDSPPPEEEGEGSEHSLDLQSDPLAVDTSEPESSSDSGDVDSLELGDEGLSQDDDSFQTQRQESFDSGSSPEMGPRGDVETFDPSNGEPATPDVQEPPATADSPPETDAPDRGDTSDASSTPDVDPSSSPDIETEPTSSTSANRSAPSGSQQTSSSGGAHGTAAAAADDSTADDSNHTSSSGGSRDTATEDEASSTPQGHPGPSPSNWNVDEVDRIDSHGYGGSGARKVANLALIVLLVSNAFLGFVALQNGWFLDFKRFDQMLAVAFQDGSYTPRPDWQTSNSETTSAPRPDPIRFEDVFVQTIALNDSSTETDEGDDSDSSTRMLVVKGRAQNTTDRDFTRVTVRGVIHDTTGKLLHEQTAPLGADLPIGELESLETPDAFDTLMPKQPEGLKAHQKRPFTIVFQEMPDDVRRGRDVHYSVEVADLAPDADTPSQ
jgi:predicted Zn finger-like uncharacterized protein